MSIRLMSQVWDMKLGDHIAKLVLLKLADRANDEGDSCYPTIGSICRDTEIPERTVKRKLAWLEEEGLIERHRQRAETGHFARTDYKLHLGSPEATVASDGGPPRVGAGASTFSRSNHQKSTTPHNPPTNGRVDEHGKALLTRNGVGIVGLPTGIVANKQEVDWQERELALRVLEAFNEMTGSNPPFTSVGWVKKIVLRVREHPELGLDQHIDVVRRALANPWWDGPASPSVVYGNGTVFEQALVSNGATKRKRRYGTGVTAGELGDLAEQLRRAGR